MSDVRKLPELIFLLLVLALNGRSGTAADEGLLSFNRDVRPILSDNCFQCHGPDKNQRQAGLRLDQRESATAERKSGRAIVPGRPAESELVKRITHADPEERMPPLKSERSLSAAERRLLRTWISQGAPYEPHWAFTPPQRPPLPLVSDSAWPRNAIDRFVLARLDAEELRPSPAASRERLLRRLSFDLNGLPPTLAELDAFVSDDTSDAVERVVARLLAGESYGEAMAVSWLDAARYADTNGYNNDTPRYNWRWRDWVIAAFNRNLPFDQFLIEQLAGDLIPGSSLDQQLATGFNRNHNVTSEGGIIDEEYRLEYVADRVHTTATVFMALSLQCARCHDHKFDPVTQKEYYQFFAFFNQVPETGYHHEHVGNPKPVIPAPTPEQSIRLEQLDLELSAVKARIEQRHQRAEAALPAWEQGLIAAGRTDREPVGGLLACYPLEEGVAQGNPEWVQGKVGHALKLDGHTHVELPDGVRLDRDQAFSYGAWVFPTAAQPMNILSRMRSTAGERGFDLTFENGPVSVHLIHHWPDNGIKVQTKSAIERGRWTHVFATYDGTSRAAGLRIYFDGVEQELEIQKDTLTDTIVAAANFRIGRRTDSIPFIGLLDEVQVYSRALQAEEIARLRTAGELKELLGLAPDQRTEEQRARLRTLYLNAEDSEFAALSALLATKRSEQQELLQALPTAMIMRDQENPRDTFMLRRGDYDKPGEKVEADVPAVFPAFPTGAPRNRLGLAQWLASPGHPLTARVMVNRLWHHMFGVGLVETLEDFGSQGAWPSHPGLLDWLAMDFVEHGWDIKRTLTLIATSATYQQSARVTPELLLSDPNNRLLARGPRFRLSAEMIRDHALSISGLLQTRIGGPSVKPYQPPGLWTEVIVADDSYSGGAYRQDHGADLYRRGVYTWWKRTCPPPALNTFDAPDREFCCVRRRPTNTPLQALVLLNDPTFVEAARALAERALKEGGVTAESRAAFVFRLATSRTPRPEELRLLIQAHRRQSARFSAAPEQAVRLIGIGESTPNPDIDRTELAVWTTLAGMAMNLDEAMTR